MEKIDTIWPRLVCMREGYHCAGKDLYRSVWFLKARACAEAVGSCWFILSAEYGLVHPDEMIEPYEMTLDTMGGPPGCMSLWRACGTGNS